LRERSKNKNNFDEEMNSPRLLLLAESSCGLVVAHEKRKSKHDWHPGGNLTVASNNIRGKLFFVKLFFCFVLFFSPAGTERVLIDAECYADQQKQVARLALCCMYQLQPECNASTPTRWVSPAPRRSQTTIRQATTFAGNSFT
jgi:hypothetical protein